MKHNKWHPNDMLAISVVQAFVEKQRWLETMTDDEIKTQIRHHFPDVHDAIIERALSQSADDGGPVLKRS